MSENISKQFNTLVPYVIEADQNGNERSYDLFSRLLRDRMIFLNGPIDDHMSHIIIGQIEFLEKEDSQKDIQLIINSPGGSVSAGLAIFDAMRKVKSPVATIGTGTCASMGAFLLSAGTPGKRYVQPNTKVMIHQPSGGSQGQETEIRISARSVENTRRRMEMLMAHFMKLPDSEYKTLKKATERDSYLNARMAVDLGLVDKVYEPEDLATNTEKQAEQEKIRQIDRMELDEIRLDNDEELENMVAIKRIIENRRARLEGSGSSPALPAATHLPSPGIQ